MAREFVTVWRIEDPYARRGPYTADSDLADELCRVHNDHAHPAPYEDGDLQDIARASEVCGFATRRLLEDWFAGYMSKLAKAGYLVVEYTVPRRDVRYGRQQVVFRRQFATRESESRPH